jgi:predicted metal-dependent RNase
MKIFVVGLASLDDPPAVPEIFLFNYPDSTYCTKPTYCTNVKYKKNNSNSEKAHRICLNIARAVLKALYVINL